MTPGFDRLVAAVRTNCHISDARHARDMTLCTYLLEMRELYRWEQGIAFGAPMARAEVGAWMSEREVLWSSLETAEHVPLPFPGGPVDPFDVDAANHALAGQRLVYGAGIGRFGKPQFFLGALQRDEWRDGMRILVAGSEHARDLSAAPAALRGGTIYLRLEALRRLLWEKAEAWTGKRGDGAFKAALDGYGFAEAPGAAIEKMAVGEAESLILHELGEAEAGRALGPAWEVMLGGLANRRAELFARAARDHLADCLVTLPALLERGASASVHFWFANLDGPRQPLVPALTAAYAAWQQGDGGRALRDTVQAGAAHWRRVCGEILALHERREGDAGAAIESLASATGSVL
jgi:hypothetical protein